MNSTFDNLINRLLKEEAPPLPKKPGEEDGSPPAAPTAGGENPLAGGEGGGDEGALGDMGSLEDVEIGANPVEEPVSPEEIELAKLAVRALYFNPESKSVHRYSMTVDGQSIPFEKVSDYFESTKNWKPILGFVEFIMDKFEGRASKWTERPEIRGKGILDKIKSFEDGSVPQDQKLDNAKRVYWARIILNALLYGNPSYNLQVSDVNEENIKEVYRKLKQDFGRDARGLLPDNDLKGPGVF